MGTTTNPVLAKKAAVLDLLRNGADIGTAAKAAGVAVRTVHDWAAKHPEFAALKADAMLNRGRVVTEGQLAAWQQELADLRAVEVQANADLLEQAAPALAGDAAALARQAELREQLRNIMNVTRMNNATAAVFAPAGNANGYAAGSIQCAINVDASATNDDRPRRCSRRMVVMDVDMAYSSPSIAMVDSSTMSPVHRSTA